MTWAAFLKKNHNKYSGEWSTKGTSTLTMEFWYRSWIRFVKNTRGTCISCPITLKLQLKELLNEENTRVSTDNAYHLAISSTWHWTDNASDKYKGQYSGTSENTCNIMPRNAQHRSIWHGTPMATFITHLKTNFNILQSQYTLYRKVAYHLIDIRPYKQLDVQTSQLTHSKRHHSELNQSPSQIPWRHQKNNNIKIAHYNRHITAQEYWMYLNCSGL